ncbi:unnamed protein product, partial [Urochloa humidicola]
GGGMRHGGGGMRPAAAMGYGPTTRRDAARRQDTASGGEMRPAAARYGHLLVIYRGTHWTRFWSMLLKEEEGPQVALGCRVLETTVMELFASNGWCFSNRLGYGYFDF